MRRPRSACAPMPGARRRRNPAGSMIAASARSRVIPFRLEVRCDDASVSLVSQTAAAQAPFTARLGEILVVAQIYDPKLLIAEFKAPATIADRGQPPSLKVNWTLGRSSVVGLPAVPQRASIVFDNPSIDRVNGPVQTPLARANHVELHGRLAEGSADGRSRDRNRAADRRRQRAGSASAAGGAVRCRCPDQAERLEGFFAKAVARTFPRNAGRGRQCRDRALADSTGRSDRGCRGHAGLNAERAGSTANCR